MSTEVKRAKKTMQGLVVSAKTAKTIVVQIAYQKQDARFKKTISGTKKVMAHDEKGTAGEGDKVIIEECRPMSKRKRFQLQKVVSKRAELLPEAG